MGGAPFTKKRKTGGVCSLTGEVTGPFVIPPTFLVVPFLRNTVHKVLGRVPGMSWVVDKW